MNMNLSEGHWIPSPDRVSLGLEEVQVWSVYLGQMDDEAERLVGCLAPDELVRAARFFFERDRRRFIVSRVTLRRILGRYLDIDPPRVMFSYTPQGKPMLAAGCGDGTLRFNLSHSGEYALVAVVRCAEIGVDLECVRRLPDVKEMADRCFSPVERALFHALPANDQLEAFFNCWTRKEAFLKALGDGLARPLGSFDVSLTPGQPAKLLQVTGDSREASRWTLWGFSVMPGTVAAVAVEGKGRELVRWALIETDQKLSPGRKLEPKPREV